MAPITLTTRALLSAAATHLHPTRTLPLLLRQQTTTSAAATTITVTSGSGSSSSSSNDNSNNAPNGNPDPTATTGLTGGAIAGIVIGSIVGFLLLVWIIRSCTNLGAPPGEEAVPGRPWYGGVRDEGPPGPPMRTSRRREREMRGRSRGRSRGGYDDYVEDDVVYERRSRSGGGQRRSRSRRMSEVVEVPVVQEVAPVRVRQSRSPGGRVYYGEGPVRGSRSRSRGGY